MNSYELGKGFAYEVSYYIEKKDSKYICCCNIGSDYYESDPCKYKENALSEVLGFLEGFEINLKKEIESIKKELEEQQ